MKYNTKSSITLPKEELKLVEQLKAKLKAKSKVDIVRRGLKLLKEQTDRDSLKEAYKKASSITKKSLEKEMKELEHLTEEGLDDQ